MERPRPLWPRLCGAGTTSFWERLIETAVATHSRARPHATWGSGAAVVECTSSRSGVAALQLPPELLAGPASICRLR